MRKLVSLFLVLLIVFGCTGFAVAQDEMSLGLWVRFDDDWSDVIADFEALHPGVKIVQEQVGQGYDDMLVRYNNAMQSDGMPNIGITGQRNGIPQLYDAGWLIPIENYLTQAEIDDVFANFWLRYTYDGKRLSLPYLCTMPACFVNMDLLRELGYESIPKTWDEMVEIAYKAVKDTNGDGLTDIYGINMNTDTPWYVEPMLWSAGGAIRQADGTYSIKTEEMKTVLTRYAQLVKDGVIPANQHGTAREDFENGRVLFLFFSCNTTGRILGNVNNAFEVGIGGIMEDEIRSIGLGGYGLSIFKGTEEEQAMSAEFLRFLMQPENALRTSLKAVGPLPFTQTLLNNEVIQKRFEDPYQKAIIDQMDFIQGESVSPVDAIVWTEITSMISELESNPDMDIDKALEKIQSEIDDYMLMY